MLPPALTLDAALRDLQSTHERFRMAAVHNLAPALLYAIEQPGPRWRAASEHPRGPAVTHALLERLHEDEPVDLRAQAAVGLGLLGEPALFEPVDAWMDTTAPDQPDALVVLQESALLAIAYLGRAAIDAGQASELQARIRTRIEQALHDQTAELRVQAATAMAELWEAEADPVLARALQRERDPRVCEGLVNAIAYLDPPGPHTCAALEAVVDGPDGSESMGFHAAVALAAARRTSARPRLVKSLAVGHERDRALEALAALGGGSAQQIEQVTRLAQRWWIPSVTRVRAAYALARMAPPGPENPGTTLLRRLRFHPRPAVREAVRDAWSNLERLSQESTP